MLDEELPQPDEPLVELEPEEVERLDLDEEGRLDEEKSP